MRGKFVALSISRRARISAWHIRHFITETCMCVLFSHGYSLNELYIYILYYCVLYIVCGSSPLLNYSNRRFVVRSILDIVKTLHVLYVS